MGTQAIEQERQYYQAKIDLCFRAMKTRESALRATEGLRRISKLLRQVKNMVPWRN